MHRRTALLPTGLALACCLLAGTAWAAPPATGQPTTSLTTSSLTTSSTPTTAPTTVELPAPSGRYRTGVTTLGFVDRSRRDPWNGADREVVVSVFYPALTVRGYPVAPQLTPRAAAHFGSVYAAYIRPQLPDSGVAWERTATRSHTGAPALPGARRVLLYSPATIDPRTVGTGLAEELASRGNVVVTVDHPGETSAVEYPDGRLRTVELPADPRTDPGVLRTMLDTRIADLFLVLDSLAATAPAALPPNLRRSMDLRRVGAYGHSLGGTTAAQALYESRGRAVDVDAAVNLEGYLDYPTGVPGQPGELLPVARYGAPGPLLLVSTELFHDARYDSSWSAMLRHPGVAWRDIPAANHDTLVDFGALVPQLESAGLMTPEERKSMVGTIPPEVSVPLVRNLVARWFSRI